MLNCIDEWSLLFSVLILWGFPASQVAAGIFRFVFKSSLQMAPCRLGEWASLSSLALDAVSLCKSKCLIIADEIKEKNNDEFDSGSSYFSLSAVMDDNLGVECVCVFVYCCSAKWPGTDANRKRPCPPTNEQHYSNGVFVVSVLRCGPHNAVTGSYAWCTTPVSFWCCISLLPAEMHVGE